MLLSTESATEPLVFNTLNLGSCKSSKTELGNSFLALFSGPSEQLHSDFQQLENSKFSFSSNKLPVCTNNVALSGNGCAAPLSRIAQLPHLHANKKIGRSVELRPYVPSRMLPTSTSGGVTNLPSSNLHHWNSSIDSTKPKQHPTIHVINTGIQASSLRLGQFIESGSVDVNLHDTANIQTYARTPSEVQSFSLGLPSSSVRGKPRVFCLGTSGDLILSEPGLLGVVCSCHGFLMSVAKFCEHAGSCVVNPGDAIRLESGETIAHWRRSYFFKSEIRVPDDFFGWDWSSEILGRGGFLKGKSATVSNTIKNPAEFPHIDSIGGSVKSAQSWNDLTFHYEPFHGQNTLEDSINKDLHNGLLRNFGEGHRVLKSYAGNSQSSCPSQYGSQLLQAAKESSMSMSRVLVIKEEKLMHIHPLILSVKLGAQLSLILVLGFQNLLAQLPVLTSVTI